MKKLIIVCAIFLMMFTSNAQEKNIIGSWQLTTVLTNGETLDGFKTVFVFDEDGVLKAARSITSSPQLVGSWSYDSKQNNIVMESDVDRDFRGTATNVKVNETQLVYDHNDATLTFTKVEFAKPNTDPIPTLSFTSDDFWGDNDEYKYPMDLEKTPWTLEQIFASMKNVSEVIYTVDQYKPNYGKVDSWTNSYKIKFNKEGQLSLREYSYFQNDYVDMIENYFPLIDDMKEDKVFYPKEQPEQFRVVGEEIIKTSLGEFNCTVIEGIGRFDKKIKYWMINEKPGVYAKMIMVSENDNPNYNSTIEYNLKEILE